MVFVSSSLHQKQPERGDFERTASVANYFVPPPTLTAWLRKKDQQRFSCPLQHCESGDVGTLLRCCSVCSSLLAIEIVSLCVPGWFGCPPFTCIPVHLAALTCCLSRAPDDLCPLFFRPVPVVLDCRYRYDTPFCNEEVTVVNLPDKTQVVRVALFWRAQV